MDRLDSLAQVAVGTSFHAKFWFTMALPVTVVLAAPLNKDIMFVGLFLLVSHCQYYTTGYGCT